MMSENLEIDDLRLLENVLTSIFKRLQSNYNDKLLNELLVSNLQVIKSNQFESSSNISYMLNDFVVKCLKSFITLEHCNEGDVTSLLHTLETILPLLSNDQKSFFKLVFSELISKTREILSKCYFDQLVHFLRVIELLLTSIVEIKEEDELNTIVTTAFQELLPQILLLNEPLLIMYTLSLFSVSCNFCETSLLSKRIWISISRYTLENEVQNETYFVIISHMFRSNMCPNEKLFIMQSEEFWTILKRSFEDWKGTRKLGLNLLQFTVFDPGYIKRNIWNFQPSQEYFLYWKTYFVASAGLEEKQTHLVLPVLSLIRNLMNNKVMQSDEFWILNLIHHALKHDSETVRLEAFLCLFDVKNSQMKEHSSLLLKMLWSMNGSTFMRKVFKMKKFDEFKTRFVKWISEFLATDKDNFQLLLNEAMLVKWSAVPLYYFLEFLTVGCVPAGNTVIVHDNVLRNFMSNVTHLHNVIIRSGIQNLFLQLLLRNLERTPKTAIEFLESLNYLNEKECLQRGLSSWMKIIEYLRESIDFEAVERLLIGRLKTLIECDERISDKKMSSLARQVIILCDSFPKLRTMSLVELYFHRAILSIKNFSMNAYAIFKHLDNRLKLFVFIMDKEKFSLNKDADNTLMGQYGQECLNVLLIYSLRRMITCRDDFAILDFYEWCLKELSSNMAYRILDGSIKKFVSDNWKKVCAMLESNSTMAVYSALKLFRWFYNIFDNLEIFAELKQITDAEFATHANLCSSIFSLRSDIFEKSKNDDNFVKAISNHFNCFWNVFEHVAKRNYQKIENYCQLDTIDALIDESLNLARPENLQYIFRTLKFIVRNEVFLQKEDSLMLVMNRSWGKLQEVKSSTYYSETVVYWIEVFVQECVLRISSYQQTINYVLDKILRKADEDGGQSYKNVASILNGLQKIDGLPDVFPDAALLCLEAFCSSHIIRKDLRIEYETVDRINFSMKDDLSPQIRSLNITHCTEEIRLKALNLLLQLCLESEEEIIKIVIDALTKEIDSCKKRYFGDSLFHRRKHKRLQLLLIVESVLHLKYSNGNKNLICCVEKIFNFVVHTLLVEPHQPSVRYLLEWLLIRVIIHQPEKLIDKFWNAFGEEIEERIGSVCSFITVAFHLSQVLNDVSFIESAVKLTLPWAMGQHFTARLYAQTVLSKLIHHNEDTRAKFQFLESGLNSCLKRGNAVKNATKLQEDFYFCHFDPINHFSFEGILWDLPRLSNISRHEWISVELFSKYLSSKLGIPLVNETKSLSSFDSPSWVVKASAESQKGELEKEDWSSKVIETQKKFVPPQDNAIKGKKKRYNLIVVASLVDKAPNLGGLSRTCEVFGVSKLVLNNLDIVRNTEFKSLSITAEKHLNIVEVKHFNLFTYLKTLKQEGYCIIGLEQTTNSKTLEKFDFPSNSVILLGNEKQGIPANLLSVLDVYVEIPQLGVIRSLNVHVSASLIIWEYVKQQLSCM